MPEDFEIEMQALDQPVTTWANAAGYRYASHTHPYRKTLCCLGGSIVFHTPDGDISMAPGDRLVLESGTPHSATVGPHGARCAEAHG